MADSYLVVAPQTTGTPGADSNTYTLFDSTVFRSARRGGALFSDFVRYVLSLKNSAIGTVKAYSSKDGGTTWVQFYEMAMPISTTQRMNQLGIPLEPHFDVRIDWVNGGAAQTTWYVAQALDDGQAPLRIVFLDAAGDPDPSASTQVTTTQLPSSLGQKTTVASLSVVQSSDSYGQKTGAASLSVVQSSDSYGAKTMANSTSTTFATDSPEHNAASMRAPLRNEILTIALTNASVTYNVPNGSIGAQPNWLGKFIEAYADGCDCWLQFDTGTAASVDETLISTTSLVSGRTSIAPSGNEAWKIPNGQWIPIPVPSNAQTFALKGSIASGGKLRTKLAQT
jgi:hypothetical protein